MPEAGAGVVVDGTARAGDPPGSSAADAGGPGGGAAGGIDGEADVSSISLRLIAGLAATAHGSVSSEPQRLDVTVDSTAPLRTALRDASAGTRLTHRLVLADAAALAEHGRGLHDVL
ncbi:MAG: hypothetical protein ACKOVB_13720, partial [Terrabacter sp.]